MKYKFQNCELDVARRSLSRNGQAVAIEPQIFDLLVLLVNQRGRVVSKEEIFQNIWNGRAVTDGVLTTRISSLRQAIAPDDGPSPIRTLHRIGYRFDADVLAFPDQAEIEREQFPRARNSPDTNAEAKEVARKSDTFATKFDETAGMRQPSVEVFNLPVLDSGKPVIAVLPLDNMSGDTDQVFFADGIAEDIITELSRFQEVSLIARNSSFAFRDQGMTISEIAEKLGARYVVEGSVRRSGNRVRITVQLISSENDEHIWAERYDRDVEDIFAVQDDVTRAIITSVVPHISLNERNLALRKPPESLGAWENYQRGLALMYTFKGDVQQEAVTYFERAIELDPGFAEAHARLAYSLVIRDFGRFEPGKSHPELVRAENAARSAVKLNDRLPSAWVALARSQSANGRAVEGVFAAEKAVALNPHFAQAHFVHGLALLLSGNPEASIVAMDQTLVLSQFDPIRWAAMSIQSIALATLEHYEQAVQLAREARGESNASTTSYVGEICALGHLERLEESRKVLKLAEQLLASENSELTLDSEFLKRAYPMVDSPARKLFHDGIGTVFLAGRGQK